MNVLYVIDVNLSRDYAEEKKKTIAQLVFIFVALKSSS